MHINLIGAAMSYADPQSLTVNAVPISLPRTGSGVSNGAFGSADGTLSMTIASSYGKRTRRAVKVTQNKVSADPLVPTQNSRSSMSVTLVVDTPVQGYTVAEAKYIVDALTLWATASTGAKVTQLLGGEN